MAIEHDKEEEVVIEPTSAEQAEKMYLRPEAAVEPPLPPSIPPTLEVQSKSGKKWVVWVLLGVVVVAGLGVGGWLFYQAGQAKQATEATQATPTPAAEVTATPTLTPMAEVDREEFEIKVLNGSGISGEAGRVRELLEEAGFIVTSAGNADKFDYKETMIEVKDTVKAAFIKELRETLEEKYMVASETGVLDGTASADVQVIVGSKKATSEE